jgi:glucosamine--fructose-6-phosphate aminotransferase (isomerizing)
MINILMAGDKHFFRHIQTVKMETNISLNIWGMNPLEVTHFKAGFLGFPPDFAMDQVFNTGLHGQMRYQALRAKEVFKNPSYINRSLWDTLSGEYYRSVKKQTDFYNLFDYWLWDETEIDRTLDSYEWERSVDTKSTWRIGDGTAAFYNYVYYTMAGFTEYDTFRSNQIREGQLSRDKALELVADENRPRYQNIKWYLDTLGLDFNDVISLVNNSPRVY